MTVTKIGVNIPLTQCRHDRTGNQRRMLATTVEDTTEDWNHSSQRPPAREEHHADPIVMMLKPLSFCKTIGSMTTVPNSVPIAIMTMMTLGLKMRCSKAGG